MADKGEKKETTKVKAERAFSTRVKKLGAEAGDGFAKGAGTVVGVVLTGILVKTIEKRYVERKGVGEEEL